MHFDTKFAIELSFPFFKVEGGRKKSTIVYENRDIAATIISPEIDRAYTIIRCLVVKLHPV